MLITILLALFYLLFPALVIFLESRKVGFVDRIGAVVVCYAAGLILGNIGVLPREAKAIQDAITSVAIPLALPLMFFSLDISGWKRTGGKALLSFGLEMAAVTVVSCAGFLIFRGGIGAETNKLAGMLSGVYTGGTINLVAIATALKANPVLLVASNASDIVASALYLLFLMTVGRRVLGIFLRPYDSEGSKEKADTSQYTSYMGIFSKKIVLPLLAAFGAAVLIAGIGASFMFILPGTWGTVTAILVISTLGIAASFIPRLRAVKMTYQLGNYFILVFCLAIGSMADIRSLAVAIPPVIGYVTLAVFGSMALHVLLCAIFKVDVDTMIITSVAGVCSPPFVPMVASALKNTKIILPGVVTGIIGWVAGTYLGIGVSYVLAGLWPTP